MMFRLGFRYFLFSRGQQLNLLCGFSKIASVNYRLQGGGGNAAASVSVVEAWPLTRWYAENAS